ncbi:MAG: KamA family radical SAM protein [Armatimonadetes bacterium]|nr:KamA family radical SAM protein [Armatimonadota bacterium]
MLQKTSEHIESLMVCEERIRRQFEISEEEIESQALADSDPLREKEHEVVPGMINKYGNRVLCLLTAECAAYCRFCTRRRLVSDPAHGRIERSHVDTWAEYLSDHPEIRDVIISGGDPFIVEDSLFEYVLDRMSDIDSIKVLRIGTRAPVSDPSLVNGPKLDSIRRVSKPVYVGIHFEHPAEITRRTVRCIKDLIASGAILYSQTVFLKDVNDDYETLYDLFAGLFEIGVRPYYIYRCDPVPGALHFRVEPERERAIMTDLRRTLPGLACPTYVIDAPDGSGKIPVPLGFWEGDTASYTDFEGKRHRLEET